MLDKLKQRVFQANLDIVKRGLVIHTWGNVSGKDPESGLIVIKPSGISYDSMKPSDMVVVNITGKVVEGTNNPSTDTPTHIILYNNYTSLGGIVHAHSTFATSWAQAGINIPPFGTTHADLFNGEIPCTRQLTENEVNSEYEFNTGKVIIERLGRCDPLTIPSILVNSHGPFIWGKDPEDAVYNAIALEEIARMAFYTILLGKEVPIEKFLIDKHFQRKHGKDAYYGQDKTK